MASTSTSYTFTNLGTTTLYVPTAGVTTIVGNMSAPSQTGGLSANTQVLVTITQNSTTVYTGLAASEGFKIVLLCAVNDAINISLTSSAPVDQVINAIKCTVTLG